MSSAARTCFGALLAAALAPSALALDAPRKVADYDIAVSLDPKTRLFEGTETLRWTNPSDAAVSNLKFHLYWNAFRNDRSTFMKESGGRLRGDRLEKENGWGFIDVTSMSWDGQDLARGFRFESPDDGNPDDRTVLSVALPRPVAPGETAALTISWRAKAPRVFARAGHVRDFYFVGQWFPKIGVLEPSGSRRRAAPAWNCHQYHAYSEFFGDWADYRVAMTVPESFVVGSAGTKVGETRAGGKKTLVYELKDAHDFAWTADPRFVVKESLFDPAKDIPREELDRASKTLGRTPEELLRGFRPVKLFFYMQPEHAAAWRKHEDAQKWALAWFGLWAFPYPYPQVSMVDPPEDGQGAGGMEYQTLYTTMDSKWLGFWPGRGLHIPEMVTIHEFGHGWWYGMLASNEFEESWMDEGIDSFTEAVMVDRHYPWFLGLPWGVGVRDEEVQRLIVARPDFDPILRNAWSYHGETSYVRNSYDRPATVIQQIRRLSGEEKFWRAFRAYAERWRWDRPTTEDFLDAMRATGIPGFEEFVRKTFYGTAFVDFQVLGATSELQDPFAGFDDAGKETGLPTVRSARKKDAGMFETVVVVGRDGDLVLPVDLRLTFENGQVWSTTWDGGEKWIRLRTVYGSKLARVDVDPDRKVVLDRNPWNNVRVTGRVATPSASAKVRAYTFHLVQILLSSLWSVA
jgi:hypothetical protein